MRPQDVDRYVRPEDIPLLDQAILEPIVTSVAKDMHQAHPYQSVEEWIEDLQKALLRGDVLIVIDDDNRRVGLVRSDQPPFLGLADPTYQVGPTSVRAADPLNLKKWEKGHHPPRSEDDNPLGGGL